MKTTIEKTTPPTVYDNKRHMVLVAANNRSSIREFLGFDSKGHPMVKKASGKTSHYRNASILEVEEVVEMFSGQRRIVTGKRIQ